MTYAYDLESRLTNLTNLTNRAIRAGGLAGLVLQQFDYSYDAIGMT